MQVSVVVSTYNQPEWLEKVLWGYNMQSFKDFEVIIVEDGSCVACKDIADRYQNMLDIHYYAKHNSGPGQTRNYVAERSRGNT